MLHVMTGNVMSLSKVGASANGTYLIFHTANLIKDVYFLTCVFLHITMQRYP